MISKRIGYGWEGYYYLDQGQLPRRTIWDSRSDKVAVEIDGNVYPTISEASRSIGESIAMISKRALSTNYPTYRRLDGKEVFRAGSPKKPEPVSVARKQFASLQAAAVEYGLTVGGVAYRCRSSNYPEWQFVDTDKQAHQKFEAAFSSIPVSVTVAGVDYTSQSEAARKYGVDINTLKKRCASASFPDWVCPTIQKVGSKDGRPGLISLEIDGEQYRSVSEACRATGFSRHTITKRLASTDWPSFLVKNGASDV